MTHILIPREPSTALLRPFIGCNTQELHEAWAAMVRIAEVQHARAGSQCLAQIEEPATLAGTTIEQYARMFNAACEALGQVSDCLGINSDIDPGAEPIIAAIEQLRAGAAPAAVAPRARDLLGIVRTAQAEARRLINGEDSGSDLAQTKLDLPETLRVLEHALSQPAAVAGSAPATFMTEDRACEWAWDKVREEVGTKGWIAGDCFTFHGFYLWGWNYRGQYEQQRAAALAALKQELTAAPALEAPAAPGTPPLTPDEARWAARSADRMRGPSDVTSGAEYAMAGAMALAKKLAAAPQAPAAPWKDHQTARLVNDLRDCAKTYHGAGQLRERIAHIVAPLCEQLKSVQAAPAAPGRLGEGVEVRCRKCGAQATVAINSARMVTHNPHTGRRRDARDIASDPEGKLMVAPGRCIPLSWQHLLRPPTHRHSARTIGSCPWLGQS